MCYTRGMTPRTLSLRVAPALRAELDTLARRRGTSRHRAALDALDVGAAQLGRGGDPGAPGAGDAPQLEPLDGAA